MRKFVVTVFVFLVMACSLNLANAAEIINIPVRTSHYMKMDMDIVRIAVGNADVATIGQIPSSLNEILIAAGNPGSTNLFIWTVDNQRHDYIINVTREDIVEAQIIEDAIGLPTVHVKKVGERLLLTGTVENQYEKSYVLKIASLYMTDYSYSSSSNFSANANLNTETNNDESGNANANATETKTSSRSSTFESGSIVDLLEILHPTQIRLEAQILAINSGDAKDLGILYGNAYPSDSPGIFAFGESLSRTGESASLRHSPLNWLMNRRADINFTINALITNNKAKILSRPSVMTLSGEQATIQIGGEIPYTSYNTNNVAKVEFKKYGIILQFKPIVDAQNNIVSAIYTEVSNVSGEYVGDNPLISTRKAEAVVSLKSGATMVIGGLMDSSERKVVNKIPLLGDIPIIGEFFKYSSKTKDKQELIILVTPYIVGEQDTSYADMTEQMEEHYREGVKEKNSRNKVDIQE